jgi:hypothetical protein
MFILSLCSIMSQILLGHHRCLYRSFTHFLLVQRPFWPQTEDNIFLRGAGATLLPACQSGIKQNPRFRCDYRHLNHRSRSPLSSVGSIFPCLCEKHLGKIGGQDQCPFLRNLKRKRLTLSGPLEPRRVGKKNRWGIKEIQFFAPRLAPKRKKIKNSLDSLLRQVAVASG